MVNLSVIQNSYSSKFNENNKINFVSFQSNNLSPLKTDTISFMGKKAQFKGNLDQINDNEFPDDLYLNLDEVYKTFEQQKSYHRWEEFPFMLADLLAKRTDYLGLTDGAIGSSHSSSPTPSYGFPRTEYISVFESGEKDGKKLDKSYEFNWTREFHELEEFFKGKPGVPGTENSMEEIKKGLPQILKKQGWVK